MITHYPNGSGVGEIEAFLLPLTQSLSDSTSQASPHSILRLKTSPSKLSYLKLSDV